MIPVKHEKTISVDPYYVGACAYN
jgi:hypothetical protein